MYKILSTIVILIGVGLVIWHFAFRYASEDIIEIESPEQQGVLDLDQIQSPDEPSENSDTIAEPPRAERVLTAEEVSVKYAIEAASQQISIQDRDLHIYERYIAPDGTERLFAQYAFGATTGSYAVVRKSGNKYFAEQTRDADGSIGFAFGSGGAGGAGRYASSFGLEDDGETLYRTSYSVYGRVDDMCERLRYVYDATSGYYELDTTNSFRARGDGCGRGEHFKNLKNGRLNYGLYNQLETLSLSHEQVEEMVLREWGDCSDGFCIGPEISVSKYGNGRSAISVAAEYIMRNVATATKTHWAVLSSASGEWKFEDHVTYYECWDGKESFIAGCL